MEIKQIDWSRIKPRIGRWVRTEAHAGQVKYDLESDLSDPFTITQFTVDFEDETVSTGWREELSGHQEEIPLTPEENHEARQMISDCRIITVSFTIRPGYEDLAKRQADYMLGGYDLIKVTMQGNTITFEGNHLNLSAAVADGHISEWANEDPEVEIDIACDIDRTNAGNWEY